MTYGRSNSVSKISNDIISALSNFCFMLSKIRWYSLKWYSLNFLPSISTIGILKFKGKKVPQIANQEVCLFGENEAGQQVPEYLDEMFNYDIIRGIGVVVVPKGKCSEYRNKLDKKMRYQSIKESTFVVHS